jgi:hypothetical protein
MTPIKGCGSCSRDDCSLLLLTGGDLGLLGTLDTVTSALDLLLGLTSVLQILDEDLSL